MQLHRVLANYLVWRIVLQSLPNLGDNWRLKDAEARARAPIRTNLSDRRDECYRSVLVNFREAISSMFVRRYVRPQATAAAAELVEQLKQELSALILTADWMDSKTKETAKGKAAVIGAFVGHPAELLDENLIEQRYSDLEITDGLFHDNLRALEKWKTDNRVKRLRKRNEKFDWLQHSNAASIKAGYLTLDNSIEVPAGILRGLLFDVERPGYLNYGSLGMVVGHELTHGFDHRGRHFDADGNQRDWWTLVTSAEFERESQCIADQYSNYVEPATRQRLDGTRTKAENIADTAGLKAAYRAYRKWAAKNGEGPKLPGLELSQKQMFFVAASSVWCSKERAEYLSWQVSQDEHSPNRFRVLGAVSNLDEFSETFNCPAGSPMNPKNKCNVW